VDLGVVDEAVDHGGGDGLVAEDLSPRPKGLLLVTITDARSYRFEMSCGRRGRPG
jgi:hypothetical protein